MPNRHIAILAEQLVGKLIYLANGDFRAKGILNSVALFQSEEFHGVEVVKLLYLADIRGRVVWVLFNDLFERDQIRFAEFIAGTGLIQLRRVGLLLSDLHYQRANLRSDVEAICGPL